MSDLAYGWHLAPNEYFVGDPLRPYLDEMRQMGMTLVVTLNKDEYTYQLCREYGMEVVIWRPQMLCTDLIADLTGLVNMRAMGYRGLVQIYNEPSDGREWPDGRPDNYVETWINRWIDGATKVYHAGGDPGVQCLDPENELRPLLREIKAQGLDFLLERIWICVHNYTSSHSPIFPFDRRTYRQNPDKSLMLDENGQPIIATIYDPEGYSSFWVPLAFDRVFREEIGRSVDTYVGEGGWAVGDADDPTYPKVTNDLHRQYHLEVVTAFKDGKLLTGEPWPRWWKGFVFWLAASTAMGGPLAFEANAWMYSQIQDPNTRWDTMDALKALSGGQPIRPTFDAAPVDPAPIDPPEEEPSMPDDILVTVLKNMWERQGASVSLDDGFFKHAVKEARENGVYIIPQPSPDGWFTVDVGDYRIAYTYPPMYAKIGDWGQVKTGLPF